MSVYKRADMDASIPPDNCPNPKGVPDEHWLKPILPAAIQRKRVADMRA